MKIIKKTKDFIELIDTIDDLKKELKDKKLNKYFLFNIYKIYEILDIEYNKIKELAKKDNDFIEYEKEKNKILFDHAIYSLNKEIIYESDNKLYFGDSEEHVKSIIQELLKEHEDTIKRHLDKQNKISEKLEENIELDLPNLSLNDLPDEMSFDMFDKLYFLIK